MTRWRVLIGSRSFGKAAPEHIIQLEEAGCEVLSNTVGRAYHAAELETALQGVDAIISGTDELTADVINAADSLKTIAKHGVGVDNIDLDAARRRGIVVTYTPGAIHDSVADLTLALLLALARQIVPAHESVEAGHWNRFTGMELRGKTLGLIGLGRIGKGVAERAQAFGMSVVAYDPYPDETYAKAHNIALLEMEDLLATAEVVSVHAGLPGGATLIGSTELALMKRGALLLNTARGHLVDEKAVADALREGRLGGIGLDVFSQEPPTGSPILGLPNVVLTPHLGGQTHEGLVRMGAMTVENCLRALRGETPLYEA